MRKIIVNSIAFLTFWMIYSNTLFSKPLQVAFDEWSPFTGSKLKKNGLSVELVSYLLKKAGYEAKYKYRPFKRVLDELRSGSIDATVDVWKTKEREEYIVFSKPYYVNKIIFLTKRDRNIEIKGLKDLSAFVALNLRGTATVPDMKKYAKKSFEVVSHEQTFRMLNSGRGDFIADDRAVLEFYQNKIDPGKHSQFKYSDYAYRSNDLCFGVSKKNKDAAKIVNDFNTALKAAIQDKSFHRIFEAHKITPTIGK